MTTKIPAELSSTPGISDSSNATAITIDSNEDVTVNNGTLTSSGANGVGNQGFHITDTGYSKTHKLFGDNSLHIQADSGQSILIKPNASEIARFTSDGLTFNGDTAAANALDDYEEGTFTPTVTSGITSVGYSAQTGYYTRIGNLVLFNLRVVTSSGNAQSSTFAVGNLPFNSAATQQPGGIAIRAYASSFSSSGSQAFIGPASNSISFFTLAGTAFAGTSIVDHDGFDLRITGIYRA